MLFRPAEFDLMKITSKTHKLATDLYTPRSHHVLLFACFSMQLSFCLSHVSCCLAFPVSLLVGFILFLVQLTGAHVFSALVVVCNESQINAACCHMRD